MTTISPKPSGIVPRASRKRSNSMGRLSIVLGVFLLVLLVLATFRSQATNVLWHVAGPLSSIRNAASVSLSDFFAGFSSARSLALENQRLRRELAQATILNLDRNILYGENVELKSKLGRALDPENSILGTVIARPPGVPYDTLMLDIGAWDGVEVGDFVSPGGSLYIGYVAEVYDKTSRVVLFSSPGQTYNAILVHSGATNKPSLPTRTAISVGGQGGGSFRAEVPAGVEVNVGDAVVFASIRPELIARVVYTEGEGEASFETVYMQLPVSISSLLFVEVRPRNNAEE